MRTILKCIYLGEATTRFRLLTYVHIHQTITIAFILTDKKEGAVYGKRTFVEQTRFKDLQDFLDELWSGELVSPCYSEILCDYADMKEEVTKRESIHC